MARTIRKSLDMSPGFVPPVICVNQYDSDFSIVFALYSSFEDFTLEYGTTAEVRGTKRSGTGYSANATINTSNKTVTVSGNNQMTAVSGKNIYEIVLFRNGKQLSSANFILICEPAALDANTIVDESVIKEFTHIEEDVQAAKDAANRAEAAAESVGRPTDQQAQSAVNNWLNEHPEATTTVQDGSLTESKFSDALKLKTIKDYVTPEMFGAKGDGLVNDSAAIQAAINSGKTVFMPNTYLVGTTLNVENDNTVIYVTGEIIFDSDIRIFTITSSYNTIFVNKIKGLYSSWDDEAQPNGKHLWYGTAFRIQADGKDVDHNAITVVSCTFVKYGFDLYANGADETSHGIAYCKINFGIIKAMYGISFSEGSVMHPWINENTFTGGRLCGNYGIYTRKGTYQTDPYNGNKFYNIGFEMLYQNAVDCEFFQGNVFENIRMAESLKGSYWINFDEDCYDNVINCQSGVYFTQLNDGNNTYYQNIYRFRQVIFGYTWGSTSKTTFFGQNQPIYKTKLGWSAEAARLTTETLSITGVQGDLIQHDLPLFGLISGFSIYIDLTNGHCAFNIPEHDGYGYGLNTCKKIYVRVVGSDHTWYVMLKGINIFSSTETGFFIVEYLSNDKWKVRKLATLD